MKEYPIKIEECDFRLLENEYNIRGTRVKKLVVDIDGNKAFFKYQGKNYNVSEACSEKMSYEIAKILNYECAHIELAKDSEGELGVLNYLFTDKNREHMDAVYYINIYNDERARFYTISNIKRVLDELDKNLFVQFIRIMVFDALVGETDRHEENWGIISNDNGYRISPLYDNGCNLLREFKNHNTFVKYYSGRKSFDAFIEKSKTLIYKEDNKTKFKHFELIEYLVKNFYEETYKEIINLNKLTDEKIKCVVESVPDDLLTKLHKEYIINYLKRRRNRILNIVLCGDDVDEKRNVVNLERTYNKKKI